MRTKFNGDSGSTVPHTRSNTCSETSTLISLIGMLASCIPKVLDRWHGTARYVQTLETVEWYNTGPTAEMIERELARRHYILNKSPSFERREFIKGYTVEASWARMLAFEGNLPSRETSCMNPTSTSVDHSLPNLTSLLTGKGQEGFEFDGCFAILARRDTRFQRIVTEHQCAIIKRLFMHNR